MIWIEMEESGVSEEKEEKERDGEEIGIFCD
jgi:hypothetical protein